MRACVCVCLCMCVCVCVCVCVMEYYSAIKKDPATHFEATWMDLKTVILKSDGEGETSYDIPYM